MANYIKWHKAPWPHGLKIPLVTTTTRKEEQQYWSDLSNFIYYSDYIDQHVERMRLQVWGGLRLYSAVEVEEIGRGSSVSLLTAQ